MEPLEACTATQRKAALVFWYQAEVNNGGHFQYLLNKAAFPHNEVVAALLELGAHHSAAVLAGALRHAGSRLPRLVEDFEAYEEKEHDLGLHTYDSQWGAKGDKEVEACLLSYLQAHEDSFVEWVE